MTLLLKIFAAIIIGYLIATITALFYNRHLKSQKFDGISWIECFSPLKHLSFILGTIISWIPWWIREQYVLRFYHDECRICIQTRHCVDPSGRSHCGCDAFKKACSPLESCKRKKYGKIIFNKKKAIEFLESTNYKIKVTYEQI